MSEILFLAHRFPYPPDRGDKIRSWNLLKALAKLAPTHAVTLIDDMRDFEHLPAVREICASVHVEQRTRSKLAAVGLSLFNRQPASVAAFGNRKLQGTVARLLKERPITSIFAFSGQMAQYVPTRLNGVRFVMDFGDVDSAKFETYAEQMSGPMAQANAIEAQRLAAFEKQIAEQADLSLFVTEAEASLFRARAGLGADRIIALENGIDLEHFHPDFASRPLPVRTTKPLIVFTGQMDYRPNIDAVAEFARDAFLIIRSHLPHAQFAIVGRAPTDEVKALRAIDGVLVTGEVADTRDWIAASDVVVAPLLLARGIQNKVLEAMAMGKAVVATPPAAEGIDARGEDGLFCVLNAREMAEQVISLVNNPERAEQFGNAARSRMEARYAWDAQLKSLPDLVFPPIISKAA